MNCQMMILIYYNFIPHDRHNNSTNQDVVPMDLPDNTFNDTPTIENDILEEIDNWSDITENELNDVF